MLAAKENKNTQSLKKKFLPLTKVFLVVWTTLKWNKTKPPHLVKDNSPQNLRKEENTNKKSLKQEKALRSIGGWQQTPPTENANYPTRSRSYLASSS